MFKNRNQTFNSTLATHNVNITNTKYTNGGIQQRQNKIPVNKITLDEVINYVLLKCNGNKDKNFYVEKIIPKQQPNLIFPLAIFKNKNIQLTEINQIIMNVDTKIYAVLLTALIDNFKSITLEQQLLYVERLVEKFAKDINTNEFNNKFDFKELNLSKKKIITDIKYYTLTDEVIDLMSLYFDVNIAMINCDSETITISYPESEFNKYKIMLMFTKHGNIYQLIKNDDLLKHNNKSELHDFLLNNSNIFSARFFGQKQFKIGLSELSKFIIIKPEKIEKDGVNIDIEEKIVKAPVTEEIQDDSDKTANIFLTAEKINNLTNVSVSDLKKMKLEKLQEIATKMKLEITIKSKTGKDKAKTKQQLVSELEEILNKQ